MITEKERANAPSAKSTSFDAQNAKLREHCDNLLIGMKTDRFSWWTHWRSW
jgi:hypothetical protein